MKDFKKPKNILVIKLSSIGDCLLATPAIESIRKGYPGSFITWLVEGKSSDIAHLNPHVDEVIVIDKDRFKVWDYLALIRRLRKRRYDLSIDLQGVDRTSIFAFLSGARNRYVEEFADLGFLSNKKISRKNRPLEHAMNFYLFLAEKSGGSAMEGPNLSLATSPEDKRFAGDFMERNFPGKNPGNTIFVGMNPSGSWKTKRWPLRYFSQVSKRLIEDFNASILIFGGKGEEYFAEDILKNSGPGKVVSAVGKTTLKQARELLSKMNYFITPDSGLMHIASSIPTLKTIALFGPTDPGLTGPVSKNSVILQGSLYCIPCFKKDCPLNKLKDFQLKECVLCMKRISPDMVYDAISKDVLKEYA